MVNKKSFLIINIALISFTLTPSFQKKDKTNLTLVVSHEGSQTIKDKKYLPINAVLTNVSMDTISYVEMSCFHPFSTTTDSKLFTVEPLDCLKNIAEVIKIPPNTSIEKKTTILINGDINQFLDSGFRICTYLTTVSDLLKVLEKRNERILVVTYKDYVFSSKDTSYRRNIRLTISGNNGLSEFDTTATEQIVWSIRVFLKKPAM